MGLGVIATATDLIATGEGCGLDTTLVRGVDLVNKDLHIVRTLFFPPMMVIDIFIFMTAVLFSIEILFCMLGAMGGVGIYQRENFIGLNLVSIFRSFDASLLLPPFFLNLLLQIVWCTAQDSRTICRIQLIKAAKRILGVDKMRMDIQSILIQV